MKRYISLIGQNLLSLIRQNKQEFILLSLILLAGLVLRLWRIDEYLPFLGDEGRDVRVVRRFLTDFDLMFIGPRTSIGDMYLGPFYYYYISPFLALFGFSPVGPAISVALLSVLTIWFIWYLSRLWFGKVAGIVAALLYTISPTSIIFAKHSWNPNIMPFFALLAIFATWQVVIKEKYKWLIVLGFTFGVIIQSHYLGLLVAPPIVILLGYLLLKLVLTKSSKVTKFITFSTGGLFTFLIMMLPLFLFDLKHNWQNFASMKLFFTNRQTTVSAKPWNAIPEMWPLWHEQVVTRLLTAKNAEVGFLISLLLLIAVLFSLWTLYKSKKTSQFITLGLIFLWGVFGLLGLGLYKQSIYDHYFGFLFPLPFILFGFFAQKFWDKGKIVVFSLTLIVVFLNLQENPLKDAPQRQMYKVESINKSILDDAKGKPFNFALIAKRNYEEGYLYFFELWNSDLKLIDPQDTKNTITDQLFVVCEDPICEPINHPKAEIASFGWAKVEKEWEIDGTKIFKLVHTEK